MLHDYPRHHLWPHLWGDNAQHEVLSPAPLFRGKCGELDHGGRNEGTPGVWSSCLRMSPLRVFKLKKGDKNMAVRFIIFCVVPKQNRAKSSGTRELTPKLPVHLPGPEAPKALALGRL